MAVCLTHQTYRIVWLNQSSQTKLLPISTITESSVTEVASAAICDLCKMTPSLFTV